MGARLGLDKAGPFFLSLPRVSCPGTRERASSPSVREGTRGRIFFLFFLPNFFCEAFPHYLKFIV